MVESFQCPYCSSVMPITGDTRSAYRPSFSTSDGSYPYHDSTIYITFFKCPKCGEYSIFAEGIGASVKSVNVKICPISSAKQFPDYIPEAIRIDYQEACAIVNLSPKSAATLSRRCLQGMIRDFWNINESNLSKAITSLEGKIPAQQWKVIDGIRRIGNIGAHMERDINLIIDIESDEAKKLIKLIEHLIEQWYINRYEQEQLYAAIIGIDETKQSERKKSE